MPRWLKPALRPVACGLIFSLWFGAGAARGQVRVCVAEAPEELHAPPQARAEVICERNPDGALRVERHVARDLEGNYFNHGPWKMWDPQGRVIGSGQYRDDQRDGSWVRFYRAGEAEILAGPIGRQFVAPFASEATFVEGQLHGNWIITDAEQREVIRWQYEHGKRHGKSVWWFPNGQKWREANYRQGQIDGKFAEWAPNGELMASELYRAGRRWGTKVEWYEPGVKRAEAHFLFARDLTTLDEDWWDGRSHLQLVATQGEDVRQGSSITYYRDGQRALQANYRNDQPDGQFIWWYPSGQKAIEGQYTEGKQTGNWSWWHANGQRWIEGEYAAGVQIGRWTWWTKSGKVVEAADFVDEDRAASSAAFEVVDAPPELASPPETPTGPRRTTPAEAVVQAAPPQHSEEPVAEAEADEQPAGAQAAKPAACRPSSGRQARRSTQSCGAIPAMVRFLRSQ